MAQYIDKSAVMAEIERMLEAITNASEQDVRDRDLGAIYGAQLLILRNLAKYLDTLEVKECNLESEQRMRECPYRQVGCTMYADKILECTGACCWVVDYLNLKKLKAQKGE